MRPDILDTSANQIYEVKSRAQASLAVLELILYKTWYDQSKAPEDPALLLGVAYKPPPRIPLIGTNKIALTYTSPDVPGLIYYDLEGIKDNRVPQGSPVLEKSTACMMMLALLILALAAPELIPLAPAFGFSGTYGPLFASLMQIVLSGGQTLALGGE